MESKWGCVTIENGEKRNRKARNLWAAFPQTMFTVSDAGGKEGNKKRKVNCFLSREIEIRINGG